MRRSATAFVSLAAVALAAYGGSGGHSTNGIGDLTGLAPAAATPAEQLERTLGILARSDSRFLSTVHGESDHPKVPEVQLLTVCGGTHCTLSDPLTGAGQILTLCDLESPDLPSETVGTGQGVTPMRAAGHTMGADMTLLRAWKERGGFSVEMSGAALDGVRCASRNAPAVGDLTGTRLTGSETWPGLKIDSAVAGEDSGGGAAMDAALNHDRDACRSDIAFSGIGTIDRRTAQPRPTMIFADVPISAEGTFRIGAAGARVQGVFYGRGHAEPAGIFGRPDMIAAFGARRYRA